MEPPTTPKTSFTRSEERTFLETLRGDSRFRIDANRLGRTTLVAIFVDAMMLGLARFGPDFDNNTLQVIVFASFVATLVLSSAIVLFVNRVAEEFYYYYLDSSTG